MARKAFTEHPKFMTASKAANDAFGIALADLGITDVDRFDSAIDATADRVMDDLTRLLLRAYDAKQAKSA